jgi:Glycosyl hydrolase family 71
MRFLSSAFLLFVLSTGVFGGTITINSDTTLNTQKSNNTSTANSFGGTSNGNPAPAAISKISIRELLYPGATTRIYVHVQPWWGKTSHINIGYKSTDPAQAKRHVNDMVSRGINGVVLDYYGPTDTFNDDAALALLNEAEQHSGFEFAICEDGGALRNVSSPTSKLISDLKHIYSKFMQSSHYMRKDGRPVVMFFSVDQYNIDWSKVRSSVPGNPLFIFRNSGGFSHTQSSGAFSWVGIASTSSSMGLSYLDNFYKAALSNSSKHEWGSAYKGFNDSIAPWGSNRKVSQQCGQTWLATFAEIGKYYSASRQLENIQIPTWNDYEEGTAIEMGIDNCVAVSASLSGSTLYWKISGGQENTIDHYNIYISKDGSSLMKLSESAVGNRSMSLRGYSLAAGTYKLFVQAVGKPSIRNKISGAVTLTR